MSRCLGDDFLPPCLETPALSLSFGLTLSLTLAAISGSITDHDPAQGIADQRAILGNVLATGKLPVDILKRTPRRLHFRCRTGNSDAVAKAVERDIERLFKACEVVIMLTGQPGKRTIILEFHANGGGFHRLYHANPVMQPPQPHCSALLRSRGRK